MVPAGAFPAPARAAGTALLMALLPPPPPSVDRDLPLRTLAAIQHPLELLALRLHAPSPWPPLAPCLRPVTSFRRRRARPRAWMKSRGSARSRFAEAVTRPRTVADDTASLVRSVTAAWQRSKALTTPGLWLVQAASRSPSGHITAAFARRASFVYAAAGVHCRQPPTPLPSRASDGPPLPLDEQLRGFLQLSRACCPRPSALTRVLPVSHSLPPPRRSTLFCSFSTSGRAACFPCSSASNPSSRRFATGCDPPHPKPSL